MLKWPPTGRFDEAQVVTRKQAGCREVGRARRARHVAQRRRCSVRRRQTRHRLFDEKHWRAVYLYLPSLLLAAVGTIIFLRDQIVLIAPPLSGVLDYSQTFVTRFYRISFIHFVAALVISAAILIRRFIVSKNTVARQQLKWVVWGSALAIVPFTLFYAIVYVLGADTAGPLTDVAFLPLILIPLSFGYSVVRYRLMDVELVVRRAVVYAATTLGIALAVGAVV